jgi:hypothetical protein
MRSLSESNSSISWSTFIFVVELVSEVGSVTAGGIICLPFRDPDAVDVGGRLRDLDDAGASVSAGEDMVKNH